MYPMIYKACSLMSTTRRFLFYMAVFLSLLSNPYISNIYTADEKLSLAPQMIFHHMFSDPKSDHTSLFVFANLSYILSPILYVNGPLN